MAREKNGCPKGHFGERQELLEGRAYWKVVRRVSLTRRRTLANSKTDAVGQGTEKYCDAVNIIGHLRNISCLRLPATSAFAFEPRIRSTSHLAERWISNSSRRTVDRLYVSTMQTLPKI